SDSDSTTGPNEANRFSPAVLRVSGLFQSERAAAPQDRNDDDILATLNGLLQTADIYDAEAFREVRLPSEAESLIRKETLQTSERIRLNRLLLEAAFPDEIRSIYGQAWRSVLIFYGLIGLFVAGGVYWYVRNSPDQHPGCNAAEKRLIQ